MAVDTMSEKILPCKCCGSEARVERYLGYWGVCDNAKCRTIGPTAATRQEAIAGWNNAAPPSVVQCCPRLHRYPVDPTDPTPCPQCGAPADEEGVGGVRVTPRASYAPGGQDQAEVRRHIGQGPKPRTNQ
jgi:hypothetical protein